MSKNKKEKAPKLSKKEMKLLAESASSNKAGKKSKTPKPIPGDDTGPVSPAVQAALDAARAATEARRLEAERAAVAPTEKATGKKGLKLALESQNVDLQPKSGKKGKGKKDAAVEEALDQLSFDGDATALEAETGGKKSKKGKKPKGPAEITLSETDVKLLTQASAAPKKAKAAKPAADPFAGMQKSQIRLAVEKAWNKANDSGQPVSFLFDKPFKTPNYGDRLVAPFQKVGLDISADNGTFDEATEGMHYTVCVNPDQV